jgi:DNA repair ATPase RecN
MPEVKKSGLDLKSLTSKLSPKSLMGAIPNMIQNRKANKLEKKYETLEKRAQEVEKLQTMSGEKVRLSKLEMLKKLYASMEQLGVDPGNIESISAFTQRLEQEDPDLLVLFENALSILSPDAPPEEGPTMGGRSMSPINSMMRQ